jgi:hypothetical protein
VRRKSLPAIDCGVPDTRLSIRLVGTGRSPAGMHRQARADAIEFSPPPDTEP